MFNYGFCQKNQSVNIIIKPVFDKKALALNSDYVSVAGQKLKFETLKFYISNVRLAINDSVIWKEKESFHLYDASNSNAIKLNIPAGKNYTTIKFDLGIDSVTNVSGAMGGDLDPTKGMYWTWQSGYINFKLEGKSDQSSNPKKEFQYHLGGYQKPFDALQTVSLKTISKDKVVIHFDVEQLMRSVDLSKKDHIMSPGDDAVKLSVIAASCFSIVQ